jgi:hypothetical protein
VSYQLILRRTVYSDAIFDPTTAAHSGLGPGALRAPQAVLLFDVAKAKLPKFTHSTNLMSSVSNWVASAGSSLIDPHKLRTG